MVKQWEKKGLVWLPMTSADVLELKRHSPP